MFVRQTQAADAAPVGATVHLQQLVVSGTDRVLEPLVSRHQSVLLESGRLVVRLDVDFAVGGQTNQAGLDSFVLSARADVALHVVGVGYTSSLLRGHRGVVVRLESRLLELLHHVSQHGVPGERRPRAEALSALRADEDPEEVVLVPVVLDTVRAVAVSARDGHRVLQHVQTYGAVELVPVQYNSSLSHLYKTKQRRWKRKHESEAVNNTAGTGSEKNAGGLSGDTGNKKIKSSGVFMMLVF